MSNRAVSILAIVVLALATTGCPKDKAEFAKGRQAELEKDYDTALIHYSRALKLDPENSEYLLRARRMRFQAAQMHVDRGQKLRDQGLLEPAAAEFEKAVAIDPSSFVAEQELGRTLEMIVAQRQAHERARAGPEQPAELLAQVPSAPPQLRPLSSEPIDLQVTEDAKRVFETIGRLARINVIFDPNFQSRRITLTLERATLEQALDIVSLMTKTFWKTVTPNTIMVIPDTPANRQAYEEQVIRTFFLSNAIEPAQLNEVVQTLRTLLDIKRITPSTANNAIIIRDTPDKVAVAEKIIRDLDQARPEVLIQVTILQARRDRARDLGILPSTSVPLIFTPRSVIQPQDSEVGGVRLDELDRVGSRDFSIVLPSATALILLTDSTTKILQNPEVRTTDGQKASLRIGDSVPFATGSFQPGIGGVGINPLVNTQFQFKDVGVNLDVTPHVHSNREVTLDVKVEVSSVTGRVNIGGIDQPIFGQRTIEHTIRLREGEVSILGGIIERSETVTISGWPGLARVPFLRYLFSTESKEELESEILIVITPRILRLPEITAANLRPLAIGTDQRLSLPRQPAREPTQPSAPPLPETSPPPAPPRETTAEIQGPAQLRFQPAQARVAAGERLVVELVAENARDLFSVPLVLTFDPAVVKLVEVHHGGFLGGEQPAALVHQVDEERGVAILSVSRPPGAQGVSGTGTVVRRVVEGLAAGRTPLAIQQVAARDSQRRPLELTTLVGEILVE
ncbi:MAG: secretin N-terminal domain-containing protein [Candidatus Acidoferrales bacterium]